MYKCHICRKLFKYCDERIDVVKIHYWMPIYLFSYVFNDSLLEALHKRSIGYPTDNNYLNTEYLKASEVKWDKRKRSEFPGLHQLCLQCIKFFFE